MAIDIPNRREASQLLLPQAFAIGVETHDVVNAGTFVSDSTGESNRPALTFAQPLFWGEYYS